MPEWFEEWFSSEEYLTVYKHRDDSDAGFLTELISSALKSKNISSVLDLACGAGRHSILLAQKGYSVTAVDLSENLLQLGRERSKLLGLDINFLTADLRNFKLDGQFDLVINLFTSFGYFITDEENFNIFTIAYKHLINNGYFVFDYFNSEYIRNNLNHYNVEVIDQYKIAQKRGIVDGRVIKEINITGPGRKKRYFESVKLYDSSVILRKFEETGFKIEQVFGNYYGEPFDENSSQRLIIIAKK